MKNLMTRAAAFSAALVIAVIGIPVAAHEQRTVGQIGMVVGWGTEPAYAGMANSVSLALTRDGRPMTDVAAGEVKVEVAFGDRKTTLDLEPAFVVGRFGTPGQYQAHLIPTRAGTYSFRFTGAHDGQRIEGTFVCGDRTFDCVADPGVIQFPEKDPSAAELSNRLEREFPRVTGRVAAVREDVGSRADKAQWLSIAAVVLGAAALVVALTRGRGRSRA